MRFVVNYLYTYYICSLLSCINNFQTYFNLLYENLSLYQ